MAEYDNKNKIAGWLRETKDGVKYISLTGDVDGIAISGALFKQQVEEGSKRPQYSGPIGVKEDRPKPAVEGDDLGDIPF